MWLWQSYLLWIHIFDFKTSGIIIPRWDWPQLNRSWYSHIPTEILHIMIKDHLRLRFWKLAWWAWKTLTSETKNSIVSNSFVLWCVILCFKFLNKLPLLRSYRSPNEIFFQRLRIQMVIDPIPQSSFYCVLIILNVNYLAITGLTV